LSQITKSALRQKWELRFQYCEFGLSAFSTSHTVHPVVLIARHD
jgi:hypothetical protein